MGRGRLTKEEREILHENPFVVDVNETRIVYSTEFKVRFMKEYNEGKTPSDIFRDAGFDLNILGSKRIERAASRWRESYRAGNLGDYDEIFLRGLREPRAK